MDTVSVAALLSTLTSGFDAAEGSIISAVASFSAAELMKLALEEVQQVRAALGHFITNLKSGMAWGEAMASMLTEVWNDTKSDLAQLATDFVDAVGKVFQSVGLISAAA